MKYMVINLCQTVKHRPPYREVVERLLKEFANEYHLNAQFDAMHEIVKYFIRGEGSRVFLDWLHETHGLQAQTFNFQSGEGTSPVILGYGLIINRDQYLTNYLIKIDYQA